jgi:uncharacterized membrane protein YvbJ
VEKNKMSNINFCPNCGSALKQGANFCSNCGEKIRKESIQTEEKNFDNELITTSPQSVMSSDETKSIRKYLIFFLVAVVIIVATVFLKNLPGTDNPIIESQPVVLENVDYSGQSVEMTKIPAKVENGVISISLELVKKNKFVVFDYEQNSAPLQLLAYISAEGKLITAVAFCEPCGSKAYHIEYNDMVCNECGTRWDLNMLYGKSGGCMKFSPDVIPSKIVGNEVHIDEEKVKHWTPRV